MTKIHVRVSPRQNLPGAFLVQASTSRSQSRVREILNAGYARVHKQALKALGNEPAEQPMRETVQRSKPTTKQR